MVRSSSARLGGAIVESVVGYARAPKGPSRRAGSSEAQTDGGEAVMGVNRGRGATKARSRSPQAGLRRGHEDAGMPAGVEDSIDRRRSESPMILAAGDANWADIARRWFGVRQRASAAPSSNRRSATLEHPRARAVARARARRRRMAARRSWG